MEGFWEVMVEGEYGDEGEVWEGVNVGVADGGTESDEGLWAEVEDREAMMDLDVECGEARLRGPGGEEGVEGIEKLESVRL